MQLGVGNVPGISRHILISEPDPKTISLQESIMRVDNLIVRSVNNNISALDIQVVQIICDPSDIIPGTLNYKGVGLAAKSATMTVRRSA